MLYNVETPGEYLDELEKDWRKVKLLEVREMIKKNGPELTEGIKYKMLSYEYADKLIFSLNAQQAYVSLYVGTVDKVENARKLLEEFNIGKGCIRIKKSIDLPESNLEKFIAMTIEVWRKGGETDC
ncbi:MAG: iron chaperone [Cyclobacteriaceae bacterium]